MSRRKAKTLEWMLSALASGCLAIAPLGAVAEEPMFNCPLAENQCSDYQYRAYSRPAAISGPVQGATHDFPVAAAAPLIPAVTDSLQGHPTEMYGCGDYDRIRLAERESLDYWGERDLARHDRIPQLDDDQDQLAHIADTLGVRYADELNNVDFQGTCYEQTLFLEQPMAKTPAGSLILAPQAWEAMVEDLVSSAVSRVKVLHEEYTPYDLTLVPHFQSDVDYWQANEHLDIDATSPTRTASNIRSKVSTSPQIGLKSWLQLPALVQTYAQWATELRYAKQPHLIQRDLYHQIEMKLCGTPALDRWIELAYRAPQAPASAELESTSLTRGSALWFADWLDQTGRNLQVASKQISRWASEPTREARLR